MKSFLEELSANVLALSTREQWRFSGPLHWVCLANGDADFHDNLILFGFHAKESDPVLVAKAPRLVENGWMLDAEYNHLVELWSCMGANAASYVPRPYGLTSIQERPVLILSHVRGESLTRLSPRSFWAHRERVLGLAKNAARTLRDLNQSTESPTAQDDPLYSAFQAKAEKFREIFQLTPGEGRALLELVNRVEQDSKTASHKILIQGDFWHGNMIRDPESSVIRLVDWQFARWSVDASPDVYFFLLAGALSATGDAPPEERAAMAFRLLREWQKDVIPEYLASYGIPDHYVLLSRKDGMMLCCVEKAVRSRLEFGYSHSDDLLWRQLFGQLMHWPDQD